MPTMKMIVDGAQHELRAVRYEKIDDTFVHLRACIVLDGVIEPIVISPNEYESRGGQFNFARFARHGDWHASWVWRGGREQCVLVPGDGCDEADGWYIAGIVKNLTGRFDPQFMDEIRRFIDEKMKD